MAQQAFEGSVSSPIGLLCLWNKIFFQAAVSGSVKHRVVGSRIYDSFVECCRRDFQVSSLMDINIVNNSVHTLMWILSSAGILLEVGRALWHMQWI
jgi:hypothetical protein